MFEMEPPRTAWDLNFAIGRVPVRVHPMFWLMGLLLGLNLPPKLLLLWIVAVFVSVLIHELGHAVAMRGYGYYPSITLYGLGGFTTYSARSGGLERIVISAAGPAAGFTLAGMLVLVLRLAGVDVVVTRGLPDLLSIHVIEIVGSMEFTFFLNFLFFINVFWGIVNLLPIYPLDGGQIAREVLLKIHPADGLRWSLMISMTAAVLLAAAALIHWKEPFIAVFFGYFAYMNYVALSYTGGGGRW